MRDFNREGEICAEHVTKHGRIASCENLGRCGNFFSQCETRLRGSYGAAGDTTRKIVTLTKGGAFLESVNRRGSSGRKLREAGINQ